jgi:phage repressor protein C with HTH and peptisase S24 domain
MAVRENNYISSSLSTTYCSYTRSNLVSMATTRGERLRIAREKRFKSARLAGKAMGIPVSTYGAHERAQSPGGRDYGPEDAKKYARRFGVTPEWLLTGREQFRPGETDKPSPPKVPVVGYVGAGAEAHLYEVAQPDLEEVEFPGSTEALSAIEIRGDSLGPFFNRWLIFYDDVRRPATLDHIGELCVVGLKGGRILVRQVQRGTAEGLFNLLSITEKPILDAAIEWVARVESLSRRTRR